LCDNLEQICLELKPRDPEVLFNWGNTLYRHARVKEAEGEMHRSIELLILSGEKYLQVRITLLFRKGFSCVRRLPMC
jgi:hypothetical protein